MARAPRVKLDGLESVRWYAAAAIIIFHVAKIPDQQPSDGVMGLVKFLNFGVPLFYVVSAFGLWYGYLGRLESRGQIMQFYRRRFFRIAPLFYVMLVVYAVLLGFNVSLWKVLTSVTFVFNLVPSHVEGIVWASWSIGVEMLFYAIMPLLALLVKNLRGAIIMFVTTVAIATLWDAALADATGTMEDYRYFSLINFLYFFAAGITGLLAFVRFREEHPEAVQRLGMILLGASAALIAVLMLVDHHTVPVVRAAWAVSLTGLTVGLSAAPIRAFVNPVSQHLGRASFSLYLLHPPIIGVMDRGGLIDQLYAEFGGVLGYSIAILITFAVVTPLALLSFRFIEQPGMKLGPPGAIANRFGRQRQGVPD